MKFVRWGLGALVAAYALLSAVTVVGFAAFFKLGLLKIEGPELTRIEPWLLEVPWWQLILGGALVVLLLVVAWRLFTGGRALNLYLIALVLKLVTWWPMQAGAGYRAAFTPDERASDYVILAALALVGLAIWWTERRRT